MTNLTPNTINNNHKTILPILNRICNLNKILLVHKSHKTNRAKEEMLGIAGDVMADYGAVSEPVARMMAEGALDASRANISVAITGVAGPGGGTPMKPVGTVHVACARENRAVIHEMLQVGDIGREQIRLAAMECALKQIQMQIA